MKRKFLIPILIFSLLFSGLFSQNASASMIFIEEKEYWSIPELLAHNEIAEQMALEKCGKEDMQCLKMFIAENSYEGIWRAWAWWFLPEQFIVSTVNPGAGYVKVVYQDGNLRQYLDNQKVESHPLEELYVAWIDPPYNMGNEVNVNGRYYLRYILEYKAGIRDPQVQFLYSASKDTHYEGWFPSHTEVTMYGGNLKDYTNSMLQAKYFYDGKGGFNAPADITSCFENTRYQPGMECRLLLSREMGGIYVPFWPSEPTEGYYPDPAELYGDLFEKSDNESDDGTSDNNNESNNSDNSENNNVNTGDQAQVTIPENPASSSFYLATTTSKGQGSDTITSSSESENDDTVKLETDNIAPLAEQTTNPTADAVAEEGDCSAPSAAWWWILLLILLGDVAIMWWMWPKTTKKSLKRR